MLRRGVQPFSIFSRPIKTNALKRVWGQHLLEAPHVVQKIVERAGVKKTDRVLEIGPGTGNVTIELLKRTDGIVNVIELDTRMIPELQERAKAEGFEQRLNIIQGDAIKVDFPEFDVFVANVPYQISSPLVNKLLLRCPPFRHAILMFQEEFASRMVAKPGNQVYSRLTVNTSLLADVEHVMSVNRNNFRPPPKVDSSVVCITPKPGPEDVDPAEFDALLRLCFLRKNKTLRALFVARNGLESMYREETVGSDPQTLHSTDAMPNSAEVEEILRQGQWNSNRAVKLSLDDFIAMYRAFKQAGYGFRSERMLRELKLD